MVVTQRYVENKKNSHKRHNYEKECNSTPHSEEKQVGIAECDIAFYPSIG